jgi:hypothetical protein
MASLYIDGTLDGSGSIALLVNLVNTYTVVAVGTDARVTGLATFHAGTSVDDVRVYNVALAPAAAAALGQARACAAANEATPESAASLLVQLKFSEGTGAVTANAGTLGGSGVVAGSSVWASAAETCPALALSPATFVTFNAAAEAVVFPKTPAMK